jgi:hypothetical protein
MSWVDRVFADYSDEEFDAVIASVEAMAGRIRDPRPDPFIAALVRHMEKTAPPMPDWEPIHEAHADARWARVVRRWEAKQMDLGGER